MAPELVSDPDHVSEKADVWSLGMVLWEMLTLQAPFQSLAPQQIIAGGPSPLHQPLCWASEASCCIYKFTALWGQRDSVLFSHFLVDHAAQTCPGNFTVHAIIERSNLIS